MDQRIRWAAVVENVREAALLGSADLAYWEGRLGREGLVPAANAEGKAQILIVAAELSVAARLLGLVDLDLSGTAVTDAGLASLAGHPNLRRLSIADTAITDQGLEHLLGLPLEQLTVHGARISQAAIERFQRARPNGIVR